MKITAVTCVKNEGPFLLEWIAFNRLIGVTDFVIYSNDCTDGTDALLDVMAARGLLTHLPNPARGRSLQMEALRAARQHPAVTDADWVWISDVDEFLNIHVGDHRLPDLIHACNDPQAISIPFQFFANDKIETFEDRPVIAQFTRSHNPDLVGGDPFHEVKTLIRRDFPLRAFGAHRPLTLTNRPRPAWTDASGRAVPAPFIYAANSRRLRRLAARGSRRFATLNHYALRSLDSYLVKADRGDVNRGDRVFDIHYWRERNDAAFEDRSIRWCLPALQEILSNWMADPEIGSLHIEAVRRHRARRDALLQDSSYRQLQKKLRTAPGVSTGEEDLLKRLGMTA